MSVGLLLVALWQINRGVQDHCGSVLSYSRGILVVLGIEDFLRQHLRMSCDINKVTIFQKNDLHM
jgi:hypothetical protein